MHKTPNHSKVQLLTALVALAAVLGTGALALTALATESTEVDWAAGTFSGTRDEVETFIKFYEDIDLTPEQEAIRVAALDPLPAWCCNNFSAATCCCECNLSRSLWGLSKHLITERDADAEMVRHSVEAWVAKINPNEWPGNTCASGRCGAHFHEGGCGGMNPRALVYPK